MVVLYWLITALALVCAIWFWLSYRRAPRPWSLSIAIVASLAVIIFGYIALTV